MEKFDHKKQEALFLHKRINEILEKLKSHCALLSNSIQLSEDEDEEEFMETSLLDLRAIEKDLKTLMEENWINLLEEIKK